MSVSEPRYETRDLDRRAAAAVVAALGALILASIAIARALGGDADSADARRARETAPAPPPPRLQVDPRADLAAVRAREHARLSGYGWIDRDAGIVRIPIERAMELVVLEAEEDER